VVVWPGRPRGWVRRLTATLRSWRRPAIRWLRSSSGRCSGAGSARWALDCSLSTWLQARLSRSAASLSLCFLLAGRSGRSRRRWCGLKVRWWPTKETRALMTPVTIRADGGW